MVPSQSQTLEALGFDWAKLLHGEQHFTYHSPIHAGDTLTIQTTVVDMYEKRGGALEFMVTKTTAHNQDGELVQEARAVSIMRHE